MIVWPIISKYCFTSEFDLKSNTFLKLIVNEFENPGLWFLKMLFILLIIFSIFKIVSKFINKKNILLIDFLIAVCVGILFLGISILLNIKTIYLHLFYFIFLIYGALLSKYEFLKKLIEKNIIVTIAILLFMFFVGHYNSYVYDIDSTIMKFLKLFLSFLSIIIFYNIFKKMVLPKWLDFQLSLFGQKSLPVYVTHFSFIYVLSNNMLLPAGISFFLLSLITVPLSIMIIYFCIMISKIVSLFPTLNFLLYGVIFKKRD